MRAILSLLLVFAFSPHAWAKEGASFYVCAHPDDCILFMNPHLYDDIARDADKVVILYVTAGDDGEAFAQNTSSYPYVRELASEAATEWMADMQLVATPAPQKNILNINGHRITRIQAANVVSYFLRLPDGNYDGLGFMRYHYASLQKLKDGKAQLASIDKQSRYENWQELVDTLAAIIAREAAHLPVSVHMADTDKDKNPHDHSDHLHAAMAMQQALGARSDCTTLYHHTGYAIAGMIDNLDDAAHENKTGSFAVLTATQARLQHHHHWDKEHRPYLSRSYYRETALPASCSASSLDHSLAAPI